MIVKLTSVKMYGILLENLYQQPIFACFNLPFMEIRAFSFAQIAANIVSDHQHNNLEHFTLCETRQRTKLFLDLTLKIHVLTLLSVKISPSSFFP